MYVIGKRTEDGHVTLSIKGDLTMADFVKSYGLEDLVVRFRDGQEKPLDTAIEGIAIGGNKTLIECIEAALPEGASLIELTNPPASLGDVPAIE